MGNTGRKNEFVAALNAQDGQQVWSKRIGEVGPNLGPQYPGARGTPTVDGELLYAIGSNGDLVCLEAASGKLVWHKDLRTDFKGMPGNWAYSESPLIDGNVLVCTPGGSEATLVALNKQNGDVIWKAAVPGGDRAAYASVTIADVGGTKEYIQFLQKGVVGIDAKTGKFLWRYGRTAQGSPANIPTPLVVDSYVYSASGRGGGALVEIKSGTTEPTQVYFSNRLPTAIGGVVKVGDYLYGTNSQGLMCADFKTGNIKWTGARNRRRLDRRSRRPALHPRRGQQLGRAGRGNPRGLPPEGRVHPSRHAEPLGPRTKGVGLSRDRQRPALYPRPRPPVVLRHPRGGKQIAWPSGE